MTPFVLLVGDALEQLRTLPDAEQRSREVTPSLFLAGGAT